MDEDGDDETLLLATLEQLYCQQALINELFLTFSFGKLTYWIAPTL